MSIQESTPAYLAELREERDKVKARVADARKALGDFKRSEDGVADDHRSGEAMDVFAVLMADQSELGRLNNEIANHPHAYRKPAKNADGSPSNARMAAFGEAIHAAFTNGGKVPEDLAKEFAGGRPNGAGGQALVYDFHKEAREMVVVTGDTDSGKEARPTITYPEVFSQLQYAGAVASMSSELTTPTGAAIELLRDDDTANVGVMLDHENDAVSDRDTPQIGALVLNARTFSSGKMRFSREWLTDAVIDVPRYILRKSAWRLARASNTQFTGGTGTGTPHPAPYGVKPGAAETLTAATKTGITVDEVVKLRSELDYAYLKGDDGAGQMTRGVRPGLTGTVGYQFSPAAFGALVAADVDARNVSFNPAQRDGEWTTWRRWPFAVNPDLDGFGTAADVPAIFGDFEGFVVRNVGSIEILPWPEYDNNLMTWRAFWRRDAAPWYGASSSTRASASKAFAKLVLPS